VDAARRQQKVRHAMGSRRGGHSNLVPRERSVELVVSGSSRIPNPGAFGAPESTVFIRPPGIPKVLSASDPKSEGGMVCVLTSRCGKELCVPVGDGLLGRAFYRSSVRRRATVGGIFLFTVAGHLMEEAGHRPELCSAAGAELDFANG
jgi:hypothetical protein